MLNNNRPIPRRRLYRLTIRSTMLLVAIIALIMNYAASFNPSRPDCYKFDLNRMSEWCASSVDAFDAEVHGDWSSGKFVWIVDKRRTPSMACLLKLAYVQRLERTNVVAGCNIAYQAVALDGRSRRTCDIFNWATQGGQSTIPPGEMASLQKLVAKLPSSQNQIPEGNILLVGFSRNSVWVTRTYDTDRLQPEILDVIAKTWPDIPWLPIGRNGALGTSGTGSQSGL